MDLLRLEQQRQALEASLQNLRQSLKHWQTYEAELEGLKEEMESSSGNPDLGEISKSFNGDLVNEKEIRDLAGLDTQSPRSGSQVLGMISRRQEYVQKNLDTVQRQFWDSEAKLEELDFMALSSAGRDANGDTLPLTEILEELDDDDNVVSSSLSQPEIKTNTLIDALRKAGLSGDDLQELSGGHHDVDGEESTTPVTSTNTMPRPALVENPFKSTDSITTGGKARHSPERPPIRKKSVSFTADTKPPPAPIRQDSEDGKKTVSFNEKVAVMPSAPSPDPRSVSFSPQVEEIPVEHVVASTEVQTTPSLDPNDPLRGMMFKAGQKVTEINDEEEPIYTRVIGSVNESEEEARARQEMLNYHLHEVGHVVAQIDLEEDEEMDEDGSASASDFASDYLDGDTPYASGPSDTEDESEDEFGRTKRRVIGDDYHKQMKELERRLIGNIGPAPDAQVVETLDPDLDPTDVRRLVIREKNDPTSEVGPNTEKKPNSKKRVSFAEALDVAEEIAVPPVKAAKHQQEENVAPVSDVVPERTPLAAVAAAAPTQPAAHRISQFKKDRALASVDDNIGNPTGHDDKGMPTGPAGKIIADTLYERPSNGRRQVAAPSADDPDPVMQRRELAAEYYRRRNDMIRQQGGFKASAEDDDLGEWMEERDGKIKKVSRFKAARITPQ